MNVRPITAAERGGADPARIALARRHLYAAEASDWISRLAFSSAFR